ncbi:MAG TPA: autotransporter-associated beta strand repeat-containing protein, partial [Luteolibacter sp.]
ARRGNQDCKYAFAGSWKGTGKAPPYSSRTDFLANLDNLNPTTANFSKVWFDHGTTATNQSLEYTVMVKPQAGELDAYASAMAGPTPPVTVTKTSKVHRYTDRATGTNAVAVFDASETLQMGDLVSVNRPGAYIWRNDADLLRLSVSSGDSTNLSNFRITLNGSWVIDSQTETYYVTATTTAGNTVVSLTYRQAAPQNVVLRRTTTNTTPTWTSPSMSKATAVIDTAYSASVAGDVSDVDAGDTRTFSKYSGPAWLNVAANGALTGTPALSDLGDNVFIIRVTDALGSFADATVTITVAVSNATAAWINPAGGSWNSITNWNGGIIAGGTDQIADFSTLNLTANATVTLDGERSIGQLKFGDTTASHDWTVNTGSGGALTLATSSGIPAIFVNNQTATLNAVLAGTSGLTKTGAGNLILTGANNYTGSTIISAGTLQLGDGVTNPTINSTYAIGSGATLRLLYNTGGAAAQIWSKFTGVGTLTLGSGKAKDSAWGTVGLAGFTGTLQIENGRVNTSPATDGGLGGATRIVVKNGAQFGLWNGGTFNQNFTIAGVGYGEGSGWNGALRFGDSGKTTTLNGTVTLAGNTTLVGRTGGFGIINGSIGESTPSALTIGDSTGVAGTITLSGNNTYTGATTVACGTLVLKTPGFNTYTGGQININNGATLKVEDGGG